MTQSSPTGPPTPKSPGKPVPADKTAKAAKPGQEHTPINWPVFAPAVIVVVAFALWAWLLPDQASTVLTTATSWIATNLGWYYILTAGIVVLFVLVIAFSGVGRTKLGPDHSIPKFNMFTWSAMLFAAGIGVDLMFFGVSGPATNFLTPPDVEGLSDEAARMAPIWTMFHYGIPGWALYALMGMAFGLFAYRYHLPLSIRSALAPIFGRRIHGPVGHGVEIAAVIGTAFGIATSLGIGVVFLNYGLSELFGIATTTSVQVALVLLAVGITIISSVSGVDKGIRRLSELNVFLALALMLWVLFSGRTAHLMDSLIQNIGDFISRFPSMMLRTFAETEGSPIYPASDWLADWTLFFWAWWIAWAPFVGLFLARISRGRTLREFTLGVLIIPFGFILLWIAIFGNASLDFFRSVMPTSDDVAPLEFLSTAVEQPESGFFVLLGQYPGSAFTVALAVLTGLLFYVTSADSGSLVMSTMTSKPATTESDGPRSLRIVWALVTGALTLVMLFIDGVNTLQSATVLVGLPLSIVLYLVMISLWRILRSERQTMLSREATLPGLLSSRIGEAGGTPVAAAGTPGQDTQPPAAERTTWRQRLKQRMTFPSAAQTERYLHKTAIPAVEQVAEEISALGATVHCHRGEHPDLPISYIDLVVEFPGQTDFKYQIYPVEHPVPSFAVNLSTVTDHYYRLEIFSATGSRGHDIMGYTQAQVISDVLDAYDAHLTFMTMVGERGAPTKELDQHAPEEWDTDL